MIRRFAAGTAVATGLALALTGCLGEAKDTASEAGKNIRLTAAQVLGKAAEKTGQVDTFKANMTMDMQLPQGATTMKMDMETRLRPEVAMKMTTSPMKVAGQSTPGFEARIVGSSMYMKMPMMASQNGGKPWSRIDLNAMGNAAGVNFTQLLDQAKQQSPAEQTKVFTASKDVREVGTETINGVQTKHYTGTVTPQDALAKMDPAQRAKAEKMYAQMGTQAIPFDLWVDGDSLPRKMIMKISMGAQGSVNTTALYTDYNKPVEVQAPPASQVGDLKLPNLGGN